MTRKRSGTALIWVALWLLVVPPAVAAAVDLATAVTARATLATALDEARAVATAAPSAEQRAVFQQAFAADIPTAWAGATTLTIQETAEGVTAIGVVACVLPVALGPWRVVRVRAAD